MMSTARASNISLTNQRALINQCSNQLVQFLTNQRAYFPRAIFIHTIEHE